MTAVGYGRATVTVTAGSVSAECAVSVEPDIRLNILGASIRIANPYGIRVGVQLTKNEAYKTTEVIEYGTVMKPAEILAGEELTVDTPSSLVIPAKTVLSENDAQIVYTGVLIDIPDSFRPTVVTARGYLKYRGADGAEYTIYTPQIDRSFTGVAQAAYDDYSSLYDISTAQLAALNALEEILGK